MKGVGGTGLEVTSLTLILVGFFVLINRDYVEAGDDIIMAKGKLIMRGGRGKGNIILDPGTHSGHEGHHSMPHMMSMMSHYNPYTFYPMQNHHHQQHQHLMIRPIYIEDHSVMNHHQHPEHHHEHHQQEYHHEEAPQHHHHEEDPQHHHHEETAHHHYEPEHHEVEHKHHNELQTHYEAQHHEPMHQHEDSEQEHHEHEGGEQEHHEGYEHQNHPMMSMLTMHGSGPTPIYQEQQQQHRQQQQMISLQDFQQPALYGQLSPEQQAFAYQQAQFAAALQQEDKKKLKQAQETTQQTQTNEVANQPSEGSNGAGSASVKVPSKPVGKKVSALLEKSANNPLVQIIKPLFKRNKDHKETPSQQKKP